MVFDTIKSLAKDGKPVDLISVTNRIREKGQLDEVGIDYINQMIMDTPASWNADNYAETVQKYASLREIMNIGYEMVDQGARSNAGTDPNEIININTRKLIDIQGRKAENTDVDSIVTEFNETQEKFKERLLDNSQEYLGIASGFTKIDNVIDGLRPGHMWLIGGYTSAGKTYFLLNIINKIMTHTPVCLFSLEMSRVDIVSRLLGLETNYGSTKVLRHEFVDQWEVDEYEAAKQRLLASKLSIYSQITNLDDIIISMMREIVVNKTKVFAIDYVQLVRTGSKSEYEQVTEVAQRLQNFARENNVTVIALSQISNEHAKDQSRDVMGFKGGGSLPASADLAIELFNNNTREERDQKMHDKQPFSVNAVIKKNRHGRTGVAEVYFYPWTGKFTEDYLYESSKKA